MSELLTQEELHAIDNLNRDIIERCIGAGACTVSRLSLRRAISTIARLTAKLAEVEGDNAALLRMTRAAIDAWGHSEKQRLNQAIYNGLNADHPGSALLAELARLRAVVEAAGDYRESQSEYYAAYDEWEAKGYPAGESTVVSAAMKKLANADRHLKEAALATIPVQNPSALPDDKPKDEKEEFMAFLRKSTAKLKDKPEWVKQYFADYTQSYFQEPTPPRPEHVVRAEVLREAAEKMPRYISPDATMSTYQHYLRMLAAEAEKGGV